MLARVINGKHHVSPVCKLVHDEDWIAEIHHLVQVPPYHVLAFLLKDARHRILTLFGVCCALE